MKKFPGLRVLIVRGPAENPEILKYGKGWGDIPAKLDAFEASVKKVGNEELSVCVNWELGIFRFLQSLRASEERPDMDKIVADVEKKVFNSLDQEVTSTEIGEMIMDWLKDLDQVAYVRFASVYRQFGDINTFMNELTQLLKKDD